MPRTARNSMGGLCYHVINRGNGRSRVFHGIGDYFAFMNLLSEASKVVPMRVLAFCLMPNHFHLVLWPIGDQDMGKWMHWLLTTHVRRNHGLRKTSGHIWQGRYKAFPIGKDEHLLAVLRYVERNPLRANFVKKAEEWEWSSLRLWFSIKRPSFLLEGPVDRPNDWFSFVNQPQTEVELEALRECVNRGTLFGKKSWKQKTAKKLSLDFSLRPQGRPSNKKKKKGTVPFFSVKGTVPPYGVKGTVPY